MAEESRVSKLTRRLATALLAGDDERVARLQAKLDVAQDEEQPVDQSLMEASEAVDDGERSAKRQRIIDEASQAETRSLVEAALDLPIPFPGATEVGCSSHTWSSICPELQQRVMHLLDAHRQLLNVKALSNMRDDIDLNQAAELGIQVLRADGDKVLLGVFDVPAIQTYVTIAPISGFTRTQTRHFYYPPRASLIQEFLASMQSFSSDGLQSGVLLSGPNGVGKSAVGLLLYICCQALGHMAVYIPDAKAWVAQAMKGLGDEFLLEQFFWQNLRRIVTKPKLVAIFRERLGGAAVQASMLGKLIKYLTDGVQPWPAIAVIVDEVQNITNLVNKKDGPNISPAERVAATYFSNAWSTWNTPESSFVRMDIASSHGTREFKLPSGDQFRLRFIRPWPLRTARAALTNECSPAYVDRVDAHKRIVHIAGGVIRKLLHCRRYLPDGQVTKESLFVMEHWMRNTMQEDCSRWILKELGEAERNKVARNIFPVLTGRATFNMTKGAYDQGLVALFGSDNVFVRPVSHVAGSILHQQLASVLRQLATPLSKIVADDSRGRELENQMRAQLDPCSKTIGTKHYNAIVNRGPAFHIHVDYSLTFRKVEKTAQFTSHSIHYVPDVTTYPCDSIIVPASDVETDSLQPLQPVLVLEYSVAHPKEAKRVDKVLKWFDEGGLIGALKTTHPNREIKILLCWPGNFEQSGHVNYLELETTSVNAGVDVFVVDCIGLQDLGIVL